MMSTSTTGPQPLAPEMRWMLIAASALVFAIGAVLFIFAASTARYFAWTVNPPVTAAFMGAGFLAAGVLELRSAREAYWSYARAGVMAVLVFTVVMLCVTLYHIDRFHTSELQAWIWIVVYAAFPPLMVLALIRQLRRPGTDIPREMRLPYWFRLTTGLQAAVLTGVGALLLTIPESVADHWPWQITALTGRAIGAWLVGFGLAAAQSTIENDLRRVRNVAISSIIFASLLFLAVVRYRDQISWGSVSSWFFVIVFVSVLVTGIGTIVVPSSGERHAAIT